MKLILKLPPENDSGIVYSLPFGFTESGDKCDGIFAVTKEDIRIYIDGKVEEVYKILDFTELFVRRGVGTSMIQGKTTDGEVIGLCGFTQDLFPRYGEVAKLLTHYIRTNELIRDTGADEPVCPKCGMPLEGSSECVFCKSKTSTMLRLVKMILPYRKSFIIALVCTVLSQAVWVSYPYLDRLLIDKYITPKNEHLAGIVLIGVSMMVLKIIEGVFNYFNMKHSFKVSLNIGRNIRESVFRKSQQLSMNAISRRTAGELINRIANDAAKLEDFITANGKDAIVDIFSVIVIGVLLFTMNPKLALMAVLPIPFVLMLSKKLHEIMAVNYTRVWKYSTHHGELLHDILNGIRVVKTYGSEKREAVRYNECSEKLARMNIRAETIWYLTMPFSWFLITAGNYFVLYFGGKSVLGETMSLGQLVQFTTYVSMLYGPLSWFIYIPRTFADASVSAGKIFEILDERSEIMDNEDSREIDINGDIEFSEVSFGYKAYDPVLKEISCKIKKGEMIGIVGHSGVGKSTMINLIMRLYDCTEGEISIDGVPIKNIAQNSLRSQIGVVLQETFLFDGSVYDNIAYADPTASFEDIIRAAKTANAHDFIVKLPDGYNTKVGNKGFQLSGGERQRIAIARAILRDPKILILDEATASLDTRTEKQIQQALDRLTEGRTTIAIAHRLSTLSNADRLFVLDKGKLAETGTHKELMSQKGVYYKLVMAQRETTKMRTAV